MNRDWRPAWARPDIAQAAVDEALERSEQVEKQGREVERVTRRLSALGRENHFQESVRAMFGVHR